MFLRGVVRGKVPQTELRECVCLCVCVQAGMTARQVLRTIGWRTLQLLTPHRGLVLALGLETGRIQVWEGVCVCVCVCIHVL